MKRVVVHVERLVLRGFGEADRGELARGLQETLSRILGESDAAQRLTRIGDLPRLDAGTVRIPRRSPAARVGGEVAHAIVEGLKA